MGEKTALDRPAVVDITTAEILAKYIAKGCIELNIPSVLLIFHGGEPMMLKPELFGRICKTLRDQICPVAELRLYIQTNGIILNETWLGLFNKYEISIGFSIDGNREAHDRYRLSKAGHSTFSLTEKNLKHIIARAKNEGSPLPTTISVIDPLNDYKEIYSYLRSLGIESMSFLLPDRNADDKKMISPKIAESFGRALYEIFEAWFYEDNTRVHITHIDRMLEHFKIFKFDQINEYEYQSAKNEYSKKESQIIIARSDGTLAVNDTYIPALSWYKNTPVYSMMDSSLKDFLHDEVFDQIEEIKNTLPSACVSCKWRKICKGGDIENRFSEKSGFDSPSIYCAAYKLYYENVCDLLVESGYPAEMIPIEKDALLNIQYD